MLTTMLRCLAVCAFAAAVVAPAGAQEAPFGVEFTVNELNHRPSPEGVKQTMILGSDGTIRGNAGCNTYSAGYVTMESAIMIQPARVSRMECSPEEMKAETRFFAVLTVVVSFDYDYDTRTLSLSGVSGGPVMRLEAAAP